MDFRGKGERRASVSEALRKFREGWRAPIRQRPARRNDAMSS